MKFFYFRQRLAILVDDIRDWLADALEWLAEKLDPGI